MIQSPCVYACLSGCGVSSIASIYHDFDHSSASITSVNFQFSSLCLFKILMIVKLGTWGCLDDYILSDLG